jgi:hypothetical protein
VIQFALQKLDTRAGPEAVVFRTLRVINDPEKARVGDCSHPWAEVTAFKATVDNEVYRSGASSCRSSRG